MGWGLKRKLFSPRDIKKRGNYFFLTANEVKELESFVDRTETELKAIEGRISAASTNELVVSNAQALADLRKAKALAGRLLEHTRLLTFHIKSVATSWKKLLDEGKIEEMKLNQLVAYRNMIAPKAALLEELKAELESSMDTDAAGAYVLYKTTKVALEDMKSKLHEIQKVDKQTKNLVHELVKEKGFMDKLQIEITGVRPARGW